MPETKPNENLNNGSPEDDAEPQKADNDDSKELADGEIADMSGDESKAADAPETIDLGKFGCFFLNVNLIKRKLVKFTHSLNTLHFFIGVCGDQPIQRVRLMKSQARGHCTRPVQYFYEIWHQL